LTAVALVSLVSHRGNAKRAHPLVGLGSQEPRDDELPAAAIPLATLHIAVRDESTDDPVAGCTINALSGILAAMATTDLAGGARLTGLRPGNWHITANCSGFESVATDLVLVQGYQAMEVRLRGLSSLRGVVTDEAAAPIPGVAVGIRNGIRSTIRYTDQSGSYIFESVRAAANQLVTFVHPGFAEVTRAVSLEGPVTLDITLTAVPQLALSMDFPCLRNAENVPVFVSVRAGEVVLFSGVVTVRRGKAVAQAPRVGATHVHATAFHGPAVACTASGDIESVGEHQGVYLCFEGGRAARLRFTDGEGAPCATTTISWRSGVATGSLRSDRDGLSMILLPADPPVPPHTFWCDRGCACDVDLRAAGGDEIQEVQLSGQTAEVLVLFGESEAVRNLAPSIRLEERLLGLLPIPPSEGDAARGLRFRVPPGVYRVTWRESPLTGYEARAAIGTTVTIDLASLLRQGELVGRTEASATCVLYLITNNAPLETARLRAADNGTFRFAPVQAGEYLLAVDFDPASRATLLVDVPADGITDVGFVGRQQTRAVRLRLLSAEGRPLTGQRVSVHGLPRQRHLLSTGVTGSDGVASFSTTGEQRLLVSFDYAFCALTLSAHQGEYVLQLPDRAGGAERALPDDLSNADDLLWIVSSGPSQLWCVSLVPAARGRFLLPRGDRSQYFLAFAPSCGPFPLALSEDGTWARHTITLEASRVPADAVSAEVVCTGAGPHDMRDLAWEPQPVDLRRPLDVSIATGFRYELRFLRDGGRQPHIVDLK